MNNLWPHKKKVLSCNEYLIANKKDSIIEN